MSSRKKRRGETGRKSSGQRGRGGSPKPRGSQATAWGSDLGSVGERDAALTWARAREQIPELAGYGNDDQVPLIFSTGPEQPEGAGPLIGEMNVAATLDDGTVMPPGTRVWLSSADPGDIVRDATGTLQFGDLPAALAGEPAPLGPLAEGLTPEGQPARPARKRSLEEREDIIHDYSLANLVTGHLETGGPGVIQSKIITGGDRDDGEPGLPHGMQPGDVIADEQPLGFTETAIRLPGGGAYGPGAKVWRADAAGMLQAGTIPDPGQVPGYREEATRLDERAERLIAGGSLRDNGPPRTQAEAESVVLRTSWTADDVLSQHAWLTHHYRDPSGDLADYLAYFIRNSVEQDRRTAGMYWPVDLSGGPADAPQGRELARLIARGLGDARTFQVTAPMVLAMREAWEAGATAHALDEGELPVPAGFAWLDAPWLMRLSAGYWLPVRAVSWEKTSILTSDPVSRLTISKDAARVVLWLAIADDVAFGRWDSGARAEKTANLVGRVTPQHVAILPFGTPLNLAPAFRSQGESLLGLLHTLWLFTGMMLPRSRPVRAAAPAVAKRARASLRHDEVHIITLRQYDYIGEPEPHFPGKIDWRGRWWVDEFYRHIDHYDDGADEKGRRRRHQAMPAQRTGYVTDDDHDVCAVCLANGQAVRIALIHAFAKGPSDKPFLRPSRERTLYRLVR